MFFYLPPKEKQDSKDSKDNKETVNQPAPISGKFPSQGGDEGSGSHEIETRFASHGSYETEIDIGVGPIEGFTVFRPKNMSTTERFPLISWGNGTAAFPTTYEKMMRHVASHGFIVVASRSSQTGSGEPILEGIDFILDENENSQSIYYQKVNSKKIGVMGHSQGGGGALTAAGKDSRISTVVAIQPDCQFTARCVGIENSRAVTLVLSSRLDVLVPPLLVESKVTKRLKSEFAFGIHSFADHMEPTQMGRGHFNEIISAWLSAHLSDFESSKSWFYGKNCVSCTRNDFLISRTPGLSKDLIDESNTLGLRKKY